MNDKDQETTTGMAKNAYAMNECMFDAVKAEIIKGFNEEQQQEMLEVVKQLRTYTNLVIYILTKINIVMGIAEPWLFYSLSLMKE